MGPGPNSSEERPKQRPRPKSNEVLGMSVDESVPELGDPIGPQPRKERHSAGYFDEPIYVMEGNKYVALHNTDELLKYLTLEMLTSKNFCAKRKFTMIQFFFALKKLNLLPANYTVGN